MDFYDINLVDEYNVPMLVVPEGRLGANCTTTGCASDLSGACPSDLRVTSSDGEDVRLLGFWEGAVLLQQRIHLPVPIEFTGMVAQLQGRLLERPERTMPEIWENSERTAEFATADC
ncbi:Pathogenesis-related thaumatin superfamily protein [Abeliophyllum distichum]|uniref:Pathogenesis-related thaumatin superfamily protein n=1 Tax=Abeliophyllum distichum TaxID=126358 RepID=A0ABD1QX75_9LAMI